MPFPTLTFAEMLSNSTREELQQMLALFEGYLRVQHKDDGSHSDITADSITVTDDAPGATGDVTADGDGTFGGNVTAQSGTAAAKAVLGQLSGIIASDVIKYGVLLGGETEGWAIYARPSGSPGTDGNELRIYDLKEQLGTAQSVIRIVHEAASSRYLLGIESGAALAIGEDASGKRIAELNVVQVLASTGYKERGRSAFLGEWTTPAYSAGNFTASSGLWTVDSGDVTTYAYTMDGKTMRLMLYIENTDVSATPATLSVAIPGGFTAAKQKRVPCIVANAGTAQIGMLEVTAGGTVVNIYSDINGTTWTTTAGDNTNVNGEIFFEVQ